MSRFRRRNPEFESPRFQGSISKLKRFLGPIGVKNLSEDTENGHVLLNFEFLGDIGEREDVWIALWDAVIEKFNDKVFIINGQTGASGEGVSVTITIPARQFDENQDYRVTII